MTSVNPNAGPIAGGQSATILGTDFGPNATITFAGAALTAGNVQWVDPNTLLVYTPAHAAGAVNVVVSNADGQSGTLTGGYTYGATPSPLIDSLSANQGPTTGGTYVTIYGSNFTSPPTVKFGGTAGTVATITDSFVGVLTPPHAAGAVSVQLTNPDTQVATAVTKFTVVADADGGVGTVDSGASDSGTPGIDSGAPSNDSGPIVPSDDGGDAGTGGTGKGGGCGCVTAGARRIAPGSVVSVARCSVWRRSSVAVATRSKSSPQRGR